MLEWLLPAVGGLSSIFSGIFGASSQRSANASNAEIARQTNENAMNIARENNATQVAMARMNNDFAHNEAKLAWERQKEEWNYNSPLEVMKRYSQAGLNPSVAFSQNLGTAASGSAPAASPAGSGIQSSMPVLSSPMMQPVPSVATGVLDSFSKFASAIREISNSKLADAQKEELIKSFTTRMNQIEESTNGQRIANAIQKAYGDKIAKGQVDKYASDIALNAQKILNLISEGKLTDAQKELAGLQADTEKWRSEQEKVRAQTVLSVIKQELDESRSRAEQNRASAEVSREEANKIRQLLPHEIELTKNNASYTAAQLVQTWEEYNQMRLTPEQFRLLQEKVTSQLEQNINDNSTTWWNPVQWVAYVISPLARQIGIALGGSGTISKAVKK